MTTSTTTINDDDNDDAIRTSFNLVTYTDATMTKKCVRSFFS